MNTSLHSMARGIGWLGILIAVHRDPLARVIDNFNSNTKTDWKDFSLGAGQSTVANGQFKFEIPAAGQPIFFASTKTSETFTLQEGRTIEFRVDMISGNSKDSFAILSWVPTSASVASLAGYSIAKSSTDVLITKGINKYFYNENPTPAIKNENVTLVLSLTAVGGNVRINGKILDKDNNNAVLFDKSFVDTAAADVFSDGTDDPAAPYVGAGNFVLYEYEDFTDGGPDVYEVVLDNAEAYVLDQTVLDDFDDNTKSDWKDFTFGAGSSTEANGQFKFEIPAAGQALFFASTKTSRTFDVVDGERIEFRVDLISGNSKDSFAILSWIPTTELVSSLAGYSLTKSTTDILVSKGINKYFYSEDPTPALKNDNVTLVLSLTGQGTSVVINAKVLDKDNNDTVLFDKTFVDTPAADVLSDGTDAPAAAYMGSGNFVLMEYEDFDAAGPDTYEVIFDNARVAAPPRAGNLPPTWTQIQPADFASFLPAATQLSFTVTDDKPLADSQISVAVNGTVFTSTNGLTLSGSSTNRAGSLAGLSPNSNYQARFQVVDADGVTNVVTRSFDTFLESDFVIEAEDYNYSGGQFINSPVPTPEAGGVQPNAYLGQVGVPEVDFHDSRASANNFTYRPEDPVGTKRTLDVVRQKYVTAGGSAAGFYDYDIGEIAAGDYLNYTRTFTAGSYEVYLRESLFNVAQGEAVLEQVTGNPTQPDPATTILGSFLGFSSGSQFRNVPLTDALGQNKVVVKLSGTVTLRLRQVTPDPSDGNIYQNYLIFVPVADTGLQRATVAGVRPAPGSSYESVAPIVTATIQNRDTSVKTNSIVLLVNEKVVVPVIAATPSGATVTYSITPLPASNSTNSVSIRFSDNQDVAQTNDWTFLLLYKSLNAANRQAGPGTNAGFNVRVVQAPQGTEGLENSLGRAELQLAPNSIIPAFYSTNVIASVINFSQNGPELPDGYFPGDEFIPGLEPDLNGTDDIAMEIRTYLRLAAGVHRFGIRCDDGYEIFSGSTLTDSTTQPLAFHNGGPADETVDFVVPETGFYPFRMIWYERGGGAFVEWFSVDPISNERTLINEASASHRVEAFTSLVAPEIQLESKSRVTDPFTAEPGAVVDAGTQTITVPVSGSTKFYRIRHPSATTTIKSVRLTANGLVIAFSTSAAP